MAQHHRGDGVSSKQRLINSTFLKPDLEDRFISEFEYNWGWAGTGPSRFVDTFQRTSQVDYSGSNPVETFYTEADMVVDGRNTNFTTYADLVIKQGIDLDGPENSGGLQKSQLDKKVGNATNGFPCSLTSIVDCPITLPDGTLTWDQAETLTAFWVGQVLGSSSGVSDQQFSHTRLRTKPSSTPSAATAC